MKRRLFLRSGTLALGATGLAACGGGGDGPIEAEAELATELTAALEPQAQSLAAAAATYPNWVAGQYYAAGSIVRYTNGQLYFAKHANPGYNPTISTWYWSPHATDGYPAWVAGQYYAAGAIVRYTNGLHYLAKYANPGYDPTISTWYWAPHAVAAPAPSPAPAPAPALADGLPAKILGCYFTAWSGTYRITDVPLDFNLIYLFHAVSNGNGAFRFDYGYNVSAAQVQQCRQRGQKVILTIGGANNGFYFGNRTQSQNFVNSFRSMYTALGGLDGCDFNNYEAELGANVTEMIWISQQLRALYGPGFAITTPPAPWSAKDKSFLQQMAQAGALTYAGPQYYDSAGFNAPGYISNSIREWIGLIGDQRRVMVGLGGSYSNGPSLADCTREWDIIRANFPNIRGMYCWSAQTNMAAGNVWGRTMKARLA